MSQIVLKDQNNTDVVFTHVATAPGQLVFQNAGSTLLSTSRLTLSLNENTNTNRVRFKLSLPTVGVDATGKPVVTYTQVASGDITAVKFSTQADRERLIALTSSLVSNDAVTDLVVSGAFPA